MLRYLVSLVTVALLALMAIPVYALDNPSSVIIVRTNVYRSVVSTNDLLILVRYRITYGTIPTEPVNETFLVRLMDVGGTPEIAVNTPYAYNDNGYGDGVASLYMSAAQVTAAAYAWQDAGVVRVEGNPASYLHPLSASYTLTVSDYSTGDNSATNNRTQLEARVLAIASELQAAWDTQLVDSTALGARLSASGELYFGLAIPGLVVMAPGVYSVISTDPTIPNDVYTNTGQTAAENRYAGVAWLTAWDTLNTQWGWPSKTSQSLMYIALVIFMVTVSVRQMNRPEPGFAFGLMVLPLFWYMGWVWFQAAALMLFICGALAVVFTVRILFRGA